MVRILQDCFLSFEDRVQVNCPDILKLAAHLAQPSGQQGLQTQPSSPGKFCRILSRGKTLAIGVHSAQHRAVCVKFIITETLLESEFSSFLLQEPFKNYRTLDNGKNIYSLFDQFFQKLDEILEKMKVLLMSLDKITCLSFQHITAVGDRLRDYFGIFKLSLLISVSPIQCLLQTNCFISIHMKHVIQIFKIEDVKVEVIYLIGALCYSSTGNPETNDKRAIKRETCHCLQRILPL